MESYDVLKSRFRIIVPEDESSMNSAIIRFIKRSFVREIGLDCEWQDDGPVSLIQIATYSYVLLFQICRFENRRVLPRELASILRDDYYVKVGVNIEEDAKRIKHRFDTSVRGWIDLRCYAIENNLLAEYLLEQLKDYESLHCTNNTGGGSKGNFGELWESPPGFLKFPKKKFPKIPQNSPKFPKKIPQNSTLLQSLFLIRSIILYILLYSQ